MDYDIHQMRDDIRAVTGYALPAEERDHAEQMREGNDESASAHIVHALRRLAAFAA